MLFVATFDVYVVVVVRLFAPLVFGVGVAAVAVYALRIAAMILMASASVSVASARCPAAITGMVAAVATLRVQGNAPCDGAGDAAVNVALAIRTRVQRHLTLHRASRL